MVLPFFLPFVMGAKIIFEAAGPLLVAVAIGHRNDKPQDGGKRTVVPKESHRDIEEAKRYLAKRRAQCEEMIRRSEAHKKTPYRKDDDDDERASRRHQHDRTTRRIVLRAQRASRRRMVTHQFNPNLPLTIAENEATKFDIQPVWIK